MDRKYRALLGILKNESRAMIKHESNQPPDNVQKAIARFAKGSVTSDERAQLCQIFQERPEWVPLLADEVKSLRRGEKFGDPA
jgi:hypothetical protein